MYDMKYSLHICTGRLVNDRFGYYSKVDPLYHFFSPNKKWIILLELCSRPVILH